VSQADVRVPDFPANEARGSHTVPFTSTIFIEQSDFREVRQTSQYRNGGKGGGGGGGVTEGDGGLLCFSQVMEKGYKRLTPDQPVGLRHAGYVVSFQKAIKVRRPGGLSSFIYKYIYLYIIKCRNIQDCLRKLEYCDKVLYFL